MENDLSYEYSSGLLYLLLMSEYRKISLEHCSNSKSINSLSNKEAHKVLSHINLLQSHVQSHEPSSKGLKQYGHVHVLLHGTESYTYHCSYTSQFLLRDCIMNVMNVSEWKNLSLLSTSIEQIYWTRPMPPKVSGTSSLLIALETLQKAET